MADTAMAMSIYSFYAHELIIVVVLRAIVLLLIVCQICYRSTMSTTEPVSMAMGPWL